MRLKKLRVKNFAAYTDETFDFEDASDLFCVLGYNGGGKSTFFVDAITVALFNEGRSPSESLIQTGAEYLEVEFNFESNNQDIVVIRRKFESSQQLELYIDGINHSEKIKETQAKINKIVNMNYDTFIDTTVIAQGKSGSFMEKKPDKRKEVFTDVLSLSRYDVLEDIAKEERKQIQKEIKEIEKEIAEIEDSKIIKANFVREIAQLESENLSIELNVTNKEKLLEKELQTKAQHEQLVKSVNQILTMQNNLKTQIDNTKSSISKGEIAKKQLEVTLRDKDLVLDQKTKSKALIESLQTQQTELMTEKSSLETKNDILGGQAKEIKAKYTRLKEYDEADCQFCGQQITEAHKNSHLTEMSSEGKAIMTEVVQNKAKIDEFNTKLASTIRELANAKILLRTTEESKTSIDKAEASLPNVESRLKELSDNLIEFENQYTEAMKTDVQNVENKTFKDGIYRIELENLRKSLTTNKSEVAVAKNELNKIEQDLDRVDELEDKLNEFTKKYAALDALVVAYSKKGIQANIIDSALPNIQNEINDFLGILTDEKVTIEFKTQKDNKSGNTIETLDIIIHAEDGSRIYETYSGGEKFRVDFACHIGFAKFLAKRAGSSIDFFVVDEGIGSQDSAAKSAFITAVNRLTTVFNKVIVITHIPEIIESFNNKVEVYKDPIHGSKIRKIS